MKNITVSDIIKGTHSIVCNNGVAIGYYSFTFNQYYNESYFTEKEYSTIKQLVSNAIYNKFGPI